MNQNPLLQNALLLQRQVPTSRKEDSRILDIRKLWEISLLWGKKFHWTFQWIFQPKRKCLKWNHRLALAALKSFWTRSILRPGEPTKVRRLWRLSSRLWNSWRRLNQWNLNRLYSISNSIRRWPKELTCRLSKPLLCWASNKHLSPNLP